MMSKIRARVVEGLWNHLADEYFGEIVQHDSGAKMRAVGWALDVIKAGDRASFLKSCGLTIGDTMYLPFRVGEVSKRWPATLQAEMLIHENYHVWQSIEYGGLVFAAGYLGNKSMRAHLEAEALKTNLEFQHWLTGGAPDVRPYARSVMRYGLGRNEVRYVASFLLSSMPAVMDGQLSLVTKVAIEWLEKHPNWPDAP